MESNVTIVLRNTIFWGVMITIREYWQEIERIFIESRDAGVLESSFLKELYRELSDENVQRLDEFMTALKQHPEFFFDYLKLQHGSIHFKDYSIFDCEPITEAFATALEESSLWNPLFYRGAFQALKLHVASTIPRNLGQAQIESLPLTMIDFCIDASKQMVLVPTGSFTMGGMFGDEEQSRSERPSHPVTLSRPFLIGKYPVTQILWMEVMIDNPSRYVGATKPVQNVSWFDCVEFCNKLSEQDGFTPAYRIERDGEQITEVHCDWEADGYRLLTEAEWEYAARANSKYRYAGSNSPYDVAWFDRDWAAEVWGPTGDVPHPVGQKKPNDFGLYDMSGNVHEWVWDWFGKYAREAQTDPLGPDAPGEDNYRVQRGGSADNGPSLLRCSARWLGKPDKRHDFDGFRIMRRA